MVCLGNICRSPLAEGILKSKVPEEKFLIDSAGTASYHIGSPPDIRSIEVAKDNNIDISKQRARAFRSDDFQRFDIIYAMDNQNFNDLISMSKSKEEMLKVKLILKNKNVPDPYYGDISDFKNVFELLDKVCDQISRELLHEKKY